MGGFGCERPGVLGGSMFECLDCGGAACVVAGSSGVGSRLKRVLERVVWWFWFVQPVAGREFDVGWVGAVCDAMVLRSGVWLVWD